MKLDSDNAVKSQCPNCQGSGTTKKHKKIMKGCPNCDTNDNDIGNGKKTLACKFCKGGKFLQKNGRIVRCKVCEGSGIWRVVTCNICRGKGSIYELVPHDVSCDKCHGKGYVLIYPFNPVIPKKLGDRIKNQ